MNIVFFSHPDFAGHQSMPRLTRMFAKGMQERGHSVEIWSPKASFYSLPVPHRFKKWMGYIDQYLVFPRYARKRIRNTTADTLFVFTDQALGPWVPLAAQRKHVMHCNDFLAQRSAMGEIEDNGTGWTGKKYQAYIRKGFQKGRNFISISYKTETDLHRFLGSVQVNSQVIYLGLNNKFEPADVVVSRSLFGSSVGLDLSAGYLLHVGGNQWYKNRLGVVEMYNAWRNLHPAAGLPLILIGDKPSPELDRKQQQSPFVKDIYFMSSVTDTILPAAYAGATLFLFPSLAEGFGWPIAEAMACGCPVITTNEAPMTEVAGDAALLIDRRPHHADAVKDWANQAAGVIEKICQQNTDERKQVVNKGIENAKRFNATDAINKIEKAYLSVVNS